MRKDEKEVESEKDVEIQESGEDWEEQDEEEQGSSSRKRRRG